jgi:hypothetical protein
MERALIIDGRNALYPEEVTSHNFQYVGIGGISGMPQNLPSVSDSAVVSAA